MHTTEKLTEERDRNLKENSVKIEFQAVPVPTERVFPGREESFLDSERAGVESCPGFPHAAVSSHEMILFCVDRMDEPNRVTEAVVIGVDLAS